MKALHRFRSSLASGATAVLFFGVLPARAGIAQVDIFKNVVYTQNSGSAPTTPTNYFADAELVEANPGDFDSATVLFPGASTYTSPGTPVNLPVESPTQFGIGPSYATQADMDSDFPEGTYTFTGTNSGTATSVTAPLDYSVPVDGPDAFTADIPALTSATFNALQGMDPTQPFTFNFNSYTPNGNTNSAGTFLEVFGTSFGFSGADTSTSATMAANTLLPNTTYTYELDFSNRINGTTTASDNSPVFSLVGFDVRTDGTFTTGASPIPEPATDMLLGIGLLGMAELGRRSKRRHR